MATVFCPRCKFSQEVKTDGACFCTYCDNQFIWLGGRLFAEVPNEPRTLVGRARSMQKDVRRGLDAVEYVDALRGLGEDALKGLCFVLGIDYQALPGDSYTERAMQLYLYMERRSEVWKITEALRKGFSY